MDAKRFYESRNPQNPAVLSNKESEEESENISCENLDSYRPFKLSFSNSFESDFDKKFLETLMMTIKEAVVSYNRPVFLWSTVNKSHRKQLVPSDDSGI